MTDMKVLAINGGPRNEGNSSIMLDEFLRGARDTGSDVEKLSVKDLNIKSCRGCLRCNLIKKCAVRGDDWKELSDKIINSDVIVFSSPVYFHHVTGDLKRVLDRFRSFVKVQIKKDGIIHLPWHLWKKKFVLLMSQGSQDPADAKPAVELFEFMTRILGSGNSFKSILGKRLVVSGQLKMTETELGELYTKFEWPLSLVKEDYHLNLSLLSECYFSGQELIC